MNGSGTLKEHQCDWCEKFKTRINVSYMVFHDEKGREWNKDFCPECVESKEFKEFFKGAPLIAKPRKCVRCRQNLETSRYYYCTRCQPHLRSDVDETEHVIHKPGRYNNKGRLKHEW